MKFAAVLLIGLLSFQPCAPLRALPLPAQTAARGKGGEVRAQGRAVADAGGTFNALGATLFWGAWAYKFDRARLERNLQTLSAAGIDYVRVLGSVGGAGWEDRQTDTQWTDYDAIIAGMTDLVYDRYGMRVQWTLFGGAPFTPPGGPREALVDRFASLARGREHKIFAFEIANEAWQNGFGGPQGLIELRRLGRRLSDRTTVLVALSAPPKGEVCATYGSAGVDAMSIHYDRVFDGDGPLGPVLRPWSFQSGKHGDCEGALPSITFNNEPIGPESSVQQDDSPSRIAAAYVMTFLAGNASYVLHAGPGIRGGGAADIARAPRRHAHFDELPSFQPIARALAAAKQYLPPGLANWTRHAPNAATAPLAGYGRLYVASSAAGFVALAVGTRQPIAVRARVKAELEIRELSTGKVVKSVQVTPGTPVELGGHDELVILGRGL